MKPTPTIPMRTMPDPELEIARRTRHNEGALRSFGRPARFRAGRPRVRPARILRQDRPAGKAVRDGGVGGSELVPGGVRRMRRGCVLAVAAAVGFWAGGSGGPSVRAQGQGRVEWIWASEGDPVREAPPGT